MNVTESCDVQTLLNYLLNRRDGPLRAAGDRAMEAAVRLADRASSRLMAGVDGAEVRSLWTASAPLPSLASPEPRTKAAPARKAHR